MQVNETGIASFAATAALGPYLRVMRDATNGLAVAGAEDAELGTLKQRHIVSGLGASENGAVVLANAPGTVKMVAAGAIAQWAVVYGAAGGKIDDTANGNPIGIALEAATADGDYIEVLRQPNIGAGSETAFPGGIEFEDDFLGDWPAAGTALNAANGWTKVETNGLGVTSVAGANGHRKFAFDAVAEAALAVLYMAAAPIDIDAGAIVEFRVAVFDKGDDASLDANIGLSNGTHATAFESITEYIAIHFDGNSLNIMALSDDGTTTVASVDTTVDAVDDTFFTVKFDLTDTSDVKISIDGTRVLSGTTFDISNASGPLTPIMWAYKSSNDTPADFRLDKVRFRCQRA